MVCGLASLPAGETLWQNICTRLARDYRGSDAQARS